MLRVTLNLENLFEKNSTRELSEKDEYSWFSHEFKRALVLGSCLQYKLIQGGPDALVV